jgi:hypothetical protein
VYVSRRYSFKAPDGTMHMLLAHVLCGEVLDFGVEKNKSLVRAPKGFHSVKVGSLCFTEAPRP